MSLYTGQVLDRRYTIEERLSEGGFGVVYRARRHLDDRTVAVKELKVEQIRLEELTAWHEAFEREAKTLSKLSHPRLASVHDFFYESGRPYLVMEYIEGRTLEQELGIRSHRPVWTEVQGWACQILDALDYLHGRQPSVIVRDLNPRNVMLEPGGTIRLIDFGLARPLSQGQGTATILKGWGTEGYAPLEQYRGTTDVRSDLYALGATLLFCLTGQHPPAVDLRITHGVPLPSMVGVPTPVRTALCAMMEIVPDARPQQVSAARLALDLAGARGLVTGSGDVRTVAASWMSGVLALLLLLLVRAYSPGTHSSGDSRVASAVADAPTRTYHDLASSRTPHNLLPGVSGTRPSPLWTAPTSADHDSEPSLNKDQERMEVADRIRRNHGVDMDWRDLSLSDIKDVELRINRASRIVKRYAVDVDWREFSLSELRDMEYGMSAATWPAAERGPTRTASTTWTSEHPNSGSLDLSVLKDFDGAGLSQGSRIDSHQGEEPLHRIGPVDTQWGSILDRTR